MKLLFLYQRVRGRSDSQQYNFDADWSFFYDFEKRQIRCKYKQMLPRNFFSDNGAIQSVSAVIGENGSGKATLARFLSYLGRTESIRSPEWAYLAVAETADGIGIFGYYKANWNEQDVLNLPQEIRERMRGKINAAYPVLFSEQRPFVYYTSFFTTERTHFAESGSASYDLSTTALLFPRVRGESAIEREATFRHEERIRVLEFLRALHSRPNDEFPMVLPRSMSVRLSDEARKKWQNPEAQETDRTSRSQFLNRYGFCAVFLLMSVEWIAGETGVCSKEVNRLIDEFMGCEREWRHNFGWHYVHFDGEVFRRFYYNLVSDVERLLATLDGNKAEQARDFILQVYALCCGSDENNPNFDMWDYFPLDDARGVGRAMNFLELYRKLQLKLFPDCLEFDFGNEISSGEMSFLTLFGRLYECFRRFPVDVEPTVFLDETEITLHPAWQRKLVRLISCFFENVFPQMRIHLIFASHSPMLLSDIPNGNVVVLRGGQPERLQMKTFGASIFDLYNVAFGLSDGVFGMQAKHRLDRLLDKMQQNEKFNPDEKRAVKLFGNELIGRYLTSWINETDR